MGGLGASLRAVRRVGLQWARDPAPPCCNAGAPPHTIAGNSEPVPRQRVAKLAPRRVAALASGRRSAVRMCAHGRLPLAPRMPLMLRGGSRVKPLECARWRKRMTTPGTARRARRHRRAGGAVQRGGVGNCVTGLQRTGGTAANTGRYVCFICSVRDPCTCCLY